MCIVQQNEKHFWGNDKNLSNIFLIPCIEKKEEYVCEKKLCKPISDSKLK